MRVLIDRQLTRGKTRAGWFSSDLVAEYRIYLSVQFTEVEEMAVRRSGVEHLPLIKAPVPPTVTEPKEIERLKDAGQLYVRDLIKCNRKLLGIWPDVVAADAAEAALRKRLSEVKGWISDKKRLPGVFEL